MSKRRPQVGDVVVITAYSCPTGVPWFGIIIALQKKVPLNRRGYEVYLGPDCCTSWFYGPDEFEVIDHDPDLVKDLSVEPKSDEPSVSQVNECGQDKLPWPYNATLSQAQPLEVKEPPVWIDGRFVTIHTYPRESLIKVNCLGCGKTIKEFKLNLFTEDPWINDCVEISKLRNQNEAH